MQNAVPSSGASFVNNEETQNLFERFKKAGDRTKDVPEKLKALGEFARGEIIQQDYRLIEGTEHDPDGKVKEILENLRYPDSGKPSELAAQLVKVAGIPFGYLLGKLDRPGQVTRAWASEQLAIDRVAMAMRPRAKAPLRRMIYGLLRIDRPNQAVEFADRLIELDPDDARSRVFGNAANAYRKLSRATLRDGRHQGVPQDALINVLPLLAN